MKCKYLDHQVCVKTSGEYRLCCISNEPTNRENVTTHTVDDWRNSATYQNAIATFENGLFPKACEKCKIQEEAGETSQRTRPRQYGPGVSHLDLRFGSNCNLQCTMCYPGVSSSLAKEHQEMLKQGIESPWGNEPFPNFDWYTDERGEYLATLPELREVYLTGGEPMMVKGLHKFLQKLDSSVEVRFNTNATIMNPNNLGYTDYETFTGIKSKVFPASSDIYAAKDRNEGCLIKDAVTRDAHIRDGFSNTLLIVECGSRPDTYKADTNNGATPTGATNQCIGWADSVGPFKLDGMDSNGDKCKNCAGNIPFGVTNNGEAFSFHPGIMNACYADGSVRTINENVNLSVFAALLTRAGGEVNSN